MNRAHDATKSRRQTPTAGRRAGMTIFEVAVSAVILGVVVTMAAQLVHWSLRLHQAALKKRCALEAATSVLDRVSARPYSALTPESVKTEALPPEAQEFLVDPRLSVKVTDEKDPLRSKRISVEVAWAHVGQTTQHVQLTTWVFSSGHEK